MQQERSRFSRRSVFLLLGIALLYAGLGGCGSSSSSSKSVPLGQWAGDQHSKYDFGRVYPVTLELTAGGGQLTISCEGPAHFDQPVTPDSNGHFEVTGTSTPCCTAASRPTRFEGTIQNRTMTLILWDMNGNIKLDTLILQFRQNVPVATGGCPG